MQEVQAVLEAGARKYGDDNWRMVANAPTRYFDATMRHLFAYRLGEVVDPDDGRSHLAHAICSLLFIEELRQELSLQANKETEAVGVDRNLRPLDASRGPVIRSAHAEMKETYAPNLEDLLPPNIDPRTLEGWKYAKQNSVPQILTRQEYMDAIQKRKAAGVDAGKQAGARRKVGSRKRAKRAPANARPSKSRSKTKNRKR